MTDGVLNLVVVVVAAFGREKLRGMQKRQIMHGDNMAACSEQGWDEVRRVEHIKRMWQDFNRQRQPLNPVMRWRPERDTAKAVHQRLAGFAAVKDGIAVHTIQPFQ